MKKVITCAILALLTVPSFADGMVFAFGASYNMTMHKRANDIFNAFNDQSGVTTKFGLMRSAPGYTLRLSYEWGEPSDQMIGWALVSITQNRDKTSAVRDMGYETRFYDIQSRFTTFGLSNFYGTSGGFMFQLDILTLGKNKMKMHRVTSTSDETFYSVKPFTLFGGWTPSVSVGYCGRFVELTATYKVLVIPAPSTLADDLEVSGNTHLGYQSLGIDLRIRIGNF